MDERLVQAYQTLHRLSNAVPALPDVGGFGLSQQELILALLIPFALVVFVRARAAEHSSQLPHSQPQLDQVISRPNNTHLLRRLLWRVRPPSDTMRIDGLVIDRTRKPHCAWLGPTGAGKSTAFATVRVNGERPMLIATPDISDPLVDATARLDGFRWTACKSTTPVNFLIGTPTEIAERLTEVFRSGGVGAWKRAARLATAQVISTIDSADEPRTLRLIGERLKAAVQADRELRTVCAGWVARFLDLADQFGSSIGPDGVDIADLLRQGKTILLDNDSFDHASLGGDVVALGLAEGKRCASLVPGGFRLGFEEAGQLGERIELAEPFHRAGRRRHIAVDDLTQAESDLNEGISANIATRVYFAQELKTLQRIAADRLGIPYLWLDPASMRDFSAYISHGKIRRLVRFPKPPKSRSPATSVNHCPKPHPQTQTEGVRHGQRWQIREIPQRTALPALPPPSMLESDLMSQIYRDGECERWRGKHDRAGHRTGCANGCTQRHAHRQACPLDCTDRQHLDNCYGLVWWPLPEPTETRTHEWQRVHRVRWRITYGHIPLDPQGKPSTIDHRATCFKDCSRLDHIEAGVSRGENSRRRWRVRGVGAST